MIYGTYKDPQAARRLAVAVAIALCAMAVLVLLLVVLPFFFGLVIAACGAAAITYWVGSLFD